MAVDDPAGDLAIRVVGVIPAAGVSRRMGSVKQTLRLGDSTILQTVIDNLTAAGLDRVIVVTRSTVAAALQPASDDHVATVINDDPSTEMIDSIRLGVEVAGRDSVLRRTDGFLVCPGDMPRISADLVRRCAATYRAHPGQCVAVVLGGRYGHPVVVPFALADRLGALRGVGLRGLLDDAGDGIVPVPIRDNATQGDVDTPDDYEQLTNRPPPE